MSKMIQVRHVPEEVHRKLKSRAALQGLSLSGYLLKEMEQLAGRPTLKEFTERMATRIPVKSKISPVSMLREERNRR